MAQYNTINVKYEHHQRMDFESFLQLDIPRDVKEGVALGQANQIICFGGLSLEYIAKVLVLLEKADLLVVLRKCVTSDIQ